MEFNEIFEEVKKESLSKFDHPDDVAKVYSGMQELDKFFVKWATEKRMFDKNPHGN